jgi:hypothetical protein
LRFLCFAGSGVPHFRQGREEKEKAEQIRPFPGTASGGGAWEDAPPLFQHCFCSSWSTSFAIPGVLRTVL